MSEATSDNNSVLLVHAYLDGELDAANALGIAQRMSADDPRPSCPLDVEDFPTGTALR
jgi:anti-sigma factor RsiW